MASITYKETKGGRRFCEIRCRVGRDRPTYTTRWDIPDGWSQKSITREVNKVAADFERQCRAGEVLSRKERLAKAEADAAKAASIDTLKQYGENIFMPTKKITCSENTRSSYQRLLDLHIYPALGDTKLPDITSAQITALLLSCQESGLSHATCVKIYAVLNLIFKDAYRTDVIDRNPMDKVSRPRPRKDEMKQSEVSAYTIEELRYIIECLDKEPLKWRAYTRLLIDTGIRRGEACGLTWQNVDFSSNRIAIVQNLCYTSEKGVYVTTPKSGRARTIDVDPEVMSLLRELQLEQSEKALSKYVFSQEDSSEPMHPTAPTHYMRQFSNTYGVDNMHPHKLRHSFASVAITNGADIASVSEILGHADKSTTMRVYAHASEESRKKAKEIFQNAIKAETVKNA
jgi:integrase